MINLEDFQKCNIRIGTIESVNKIPEADKLLKFIIDFGGEKRYDEWNCGVYYRSRIARWKASSGILNLEPREFRGFESQGDTYGRRHR